MIKDRAFLQLQPSDYRHFWHIKCGDGKNIRVSVPYSLWKEGEDGFRVEKTAGRRWPGIDSSEYRKKQEEREKIMDMIFGN